MAIQSSFYTPDGSTRTFPSTKHIASKQHMAVWFRRLTDSVWVVQNVSTYELINNTAVLVEAPDVALYDNIEIRVADTQDELTDSPSEISIVAGIATEVVNVSDNMSDVQFVADNISVIGAEKLIANVPNFTSLQEVNTTYTTKVNLTELHPGIAESGGTFTWNPLADKATANPGTRIDPSVSLSLQGTGLGLGCWEREYAGYINSSYAGTIGDGVYDNTSAFAVLDSLNEAIYIPDGIYLVTSSPTGRYFADNAFVTNGVTTYKVSSLPNKLALLSDVITIGANALGKNVGGSSSVVIGNNAGANIEYTNANVLIGDSAGAELLRDAALPFEGIHNVLIGRYAGRSTTTGYYNTFVGAGSGDANTTGKANTFIGQNAGRSNTVSSDNTFIGEGACANAIPGNSCTAIGVNAAIYSSGTTFTAIGSASLFMYFTGDNNTAVGSSSMYGANDGAGDGGYNPLRTYAANNNTAIGKESLFFIDNGTNNTGIGRRSLYSIEDGDFNVAIGAEAGYNYPGNTSVFIGYRTGYDVSTGSNHTMAGHNAGYYNNGSNNTLIGYTAGKGSAGASDYSNSVAVGHEAGLVWQTGASSSVAIGRRALYANTIAGFNTAVGEQAGSTNVSFSNISCLGYNSQVTGSNQIQLGNSSTTTYAYGAIQDRSDIRDKADIKNITDAHIAFFMDIEWKQYRFDYREDYIEVSEDGETINHDRDGSKARTRYHTGAIAQQVEEAMKRHGVDFAGLQHHLIKGGLDVYTIGYQEFIAIQGEIIQRQAKRLDAIEQRLNTAGI